MKCTRDEGALDSPLMKKVDRTQQSRASVNVTDGKSGVKNMTPSYTTDNGTSWIDISMNYNTTTGFYEAIIPEQPVGTLVKYEIIAFDSANNKSVENNSGQYFVYTVIPEFTTIIVSLLFLLFSIMVILVAKRKMAKNKNYSN